MPLIFELFILQLSILEADQKCKGLRLRSQANIVDGPRNEAYERR